MKNDEKTVEKDRILLWGCVLEEKKRRFLWECVLGGSAEN